MEGRKLGFLEDKLSPLPEVRGADRFVLSLIPYEETTTYIKGTSKAPEAIVQASGHMELLDESLGIDASRFGIMTLRPDIDGLKSITKHARKVKNELKDAFHGFLGGEHSITPAILEGLEEDSLGIVWIDAHSDLRKAYAGRADNHACAGFNSTPFGRIVQVGVRTLAREEAEFLEQSDQVVAYRHWGKQVEEEVEKLPQKVYLSVDADGFSPALIRSVGTPEPGGLSWEEVLELLDFLFRKKDVRAFDVVELCPQPGDVASTFIIAKLVYKIITFHALYKLEKRTPNPLLP